MEREQSLPVQILFDAQSESKFQPLQFVANFDPRLDETKYLLLFYFVIVVLHKVLVSKIVKHGMFV